MEVSVLHPRQFQVNEAWIAFTLNRIPIQTETDGSFNCLCLMDAASCFILATSMIVADESGPSILEARRLFKAAQAHRPEKPTTLFVPTGPIRAHVVAEATRRGMQVISVAAKDLRIFVAEAQDGFLDHVQQLAAE